MRLSASAKQPPLATSTRQTPNTLDPSCPPPKENSPVANYSLVPKCHSTSTMMLPCISGRKYTNQQQSNHRHNCAASSGIWRPHAGCDAAPRKARWSPAGFLGSRGGPFPSGRLWGGVSGLRCGGSLNRYFAR